MSLKFFSVLKSLKVKVACLFLRGALAAWFERVAEPQMYRWNKFRSSLERNFGSFGADWESKMVKEFGNNTEDSSEGGLGRCEVASPSSAPGGDTGDSSGSKEDTAGTETRSGELFPKLCKLIYIMRVV